MTVPDWFSWNNAGADIAVGDVDGDGQLDLVILMVDAPDGPNQGYYRSGPLHVDGTVGAWRPWGAVPDWYFWENQGAGVAVADLDGDGTPELVVMAVDNPPGQDGGYYTTGWRLAGGRPADGWGPWQSIPDRRFWGNAGAALTIANAAVPDPAQIASACLIRPGATTHSTDGEQRLVGLPHQAAGQGQLGLQLPQNSSLAPPGWYMLFVVSTDGVPSEAAWVHLT